MLRKGGRLHRTAARERASRRACERERPRHLKLQQLRRRKEKRNLDRCILVGVRSVDRILFDRFAEIFANRSRIRFRRIGCAHHFAEMRDRVVAFECGDVDGTGRHVVDEALIKRPLRVNGVKTLRLFLRQSDFFQAEDFESFAFEAAGDFSEIAFANGVRLHDRKRAVRHSGRGL